MRYSTLSVTTAAGSTSFTVGNQARITITSAWAVPGERGRYSFRGFREVDPSGSPLRPGWWQLPTSYWEASHTVDPVSRVSALSYDAGTGEVTVTEAGGGSELRGDGTTSDGSWTKTTAFPVDAGSELRIFGARVSSADAGLVNATVPLNGLSAISITEAA